MSSSDLEDDLISYGTALEPLEEDEIPCKKPRLLEDQVVKDKYGKRRFHGAFTGGFSAGFFNTVGSLEGWTPSLFKSSKSKKQEHHQQKPEDFMDEEVKILSGHYFLPVSNRWQEIHLGVVLQCAVLMCNGHFLDLSDLSEFGIAPVLLKARQDYTNEKSKIVSHLHRSQTIGTYVLEDLFKPVRETMGIKLLKKMGWKPGQGVGPRLNKNEKKNSLKIQQKTYGCQLPPGSLVEKEDVSSNSDSEWDEIEFAPDDYEPLLCEARNNFCGLGYQGLDKRLILSTSPSRSKNYNNLEQNRKMAFGSQAFGVGAFEEEDEDIYARDDMSRYDFSLGNDVINKSPDKKVLTVHGVIEGFIFEKTKHIRKKYPLPTLPKDFKPRHKCRISRFEDISPTDKKNTKRLELNFESRKKLLQNCREETEVKGSERGDETLVKELISNVKIDINNAFKPFTSNPEKQERYENYLKLIKIGKKERLSDLQPSSMTNWEKEREKAEFEKASSLFKPLSGEMGDRFLTASQPDDLSNPLAVVEKFHDDGDDTRRAAKMNMFGPLTRKTEEWTPEQLLCKRFNIPQPKSSGQNVEKKSAKRNFNLFAIGEELKKNAEDSENVTDFGESLREETKEPESEKDGAADVDLNDVSNKADLFRAIFLASDDDAEDEEKSSKDFMTKENSENVSFEERVINSKRNLSPPSGIFENVDFELLSVPRKKVTDAQPEELRKSQNEPPEKVESDTVPSNLVYGPKIPDKTLLKVVPAFTTQNLREDDVWVEKKPHGKKHHKKKDKKNKKTSHKVKHKHKKHKR